MISGAPKLSLSLLNTEETWYCRTEIDAVTSQHRSFRRQAGVGNHGARTNHHGGSAVTRMAETENRQSREMSAAALRANMRVVVHVVEKDIEEPSLFRKRMPWHWHVL